MRRGVLGVVGGGGYMGIEGMQNSTFFGEGQMSKVGLSLSMDLLRVGLSAS